MPSRLRWPTLLPRPAVKAFDTVWILGEKPVYSAPADVKLAQALKDIPNTVYATDYADETAELVAWAVPTAHVLESWGDVRGVDGSYGIGQPQIEPLLKGKSLIEILALLTAAKLLRASTWSRRRPVP